MRHLFLLGSVGLLAAGQGLATDYTRERTLRVEATTEIDLESTMEMLIDGQPPEDRGGRGGPGGGSSTLIRKAAWLDQVLERKDGQPLRLKRSYETLKDESESAFGEFSRTDEHDSPLAGLVVEFSRDEDGEVQAEVVEGSAPDDDSLLEGHQLTLGLDALLPEGDAAQGDAWELDHDSIRRALAASLDPRLFPEVPPDFGGGGGERGEGGGGGRRGGRGPRGGGPARLLPLIEWEGKAVLAEASVDHEGESCARIHLELEGRGELPDAPAFGGGGPRRGRRFDFAPELPAFLLAGEIEAHLEGDLFVSLDKHMPVALELDGRLSSESSSERERDGSTFSMHSTQTGRLSVVVAVEEQ